MLDNFNLLIENKLSSVLKVKDTEYSELISAMEYSVGAGGKRIRPKLMLKFAELCGAEPSKALNFACALEMIHTYSLIHDDLPCMDNDDTRRGKPSCHIAFGEATALLAGDALLTDAFSLALSTEDVPSDRAVAAALVLSRCAGSDGMIGGQVIDLKYEERETPLETVKELYRLKTGALLKAAAEIGCILAGASDEKLSAARCFAENLGLAFQIRDDILDIIGDEKLLGKPVGSDGKSQKSTYVAHVGLDKAQSDVEAYTDNAVKALEIFGDGAVELKELARSLMIRKN